MSSFPPPPQVAASAVRPRKPSRGQIVMARRVTKKPPEPPTTVRYLGQALGELPGMQRATPAGRSVRAQQTCPGALSGSQALPASAAGQNGQHKPSFGSQKNAGEHWVCMLHDSNSRSPLRAQ